MKRKEPVRALAPMLEALGIKQTVSVEECSALFTEMYEVIRTTPPSFELSGNQWCALVNLAIARHGTPNAEVIGAIRLAGEASASTVGLEGNEGDGNV